MTEDEITTDWRQEEIIRDLGQRKKIKREETEVEIIRDRRQRRKLQEKWYFKKSRIRETPTPPTNCDLSWVKTRRGRPR